jgi:hypothetical protein
VTSEGSVRGQSLFSDIVLDYRRRFEECSLIQTDVFIVPGLLYLMNNKKM